ncbi:MAG: hypothetical protein JRN10_04560 [Nitrososphaerota archaeon]|nr:hypothetical protein [Nitrososphaerota archaeon]MDG6930497.1 hypothetical protein [Nitrososphaerota archaeon]
MKSNAESGLSSRGRLRIIRELELAGMPLSMYMLEKKTGIRRRTLRFDINSLVTINWVRAIPGRITRYELNRENYELMVMIRALREINYVS